MLIITFLIAANQKFALLSAFLHHIGAAFRTLFLDRQIPAAEIALGIIAAAIENASFLTAALDDFAAAFGARHPDFF